jgi:hypothetical protein
MWGDLTNQSPGKRCGMAKAFCLKAKEKYKVIFGGG